jgi:hypothetical protein
LPDLDFEKYVARARKDADRAVQALTKEAERLRGRLAVVEESLAKWKQLSSALGNPNQAALRPAEPGGVEIVAPPDSDPVAVSTVVEPIPEGSSTRP